MLTLILVIALTLLLAACGTLTGIPSHGGGKRFAVERENHTLLIKPTTTSWEASYQEKYALWMGPLKTEKRIKPSGGLLVSFSDITPYSSPSPDAQPQGQHCSSPPLHKLLIRKYQPGKQP